MSGTWSAQQVVRAAHAHSAALAREKEWYDEQIRLHRRDLHAVDGATEAAWEHLTAVLVPELTPAHLDRAARACHLSSIASAAVQDGMQREAERARRRILEIDANPDHVQREGLIATCEIRIAECDETIAPLRAGFAAILDDPTWTRLHASGYGTPEYAAKWYQLSYYRDWKEADELVERHGPALGLGEWAPLRAKAVEAAEAIATLQAERDEQAARKAGIERLVQSRRDAEQALANLPARQLAEVRGRLRGHLEPLGLERVATLFPGDPGLAQAIQRLSGLAAKRHYLEETARNFLVEPREQVAEAQLRNARDMQKLSRPKNAGRTFPGEQMTKRFRDRGPALSKRRQRYEDTRGQLLAFDAYDRGRMVENFLWWDVMTDGRIDGNFIPEVHHHHVHHPRDDHAAAVAAVASSPGRDDDALLLHDGS